jgi:HTH-type transcriptional regulator/antitoxin HigA
MKKIYNEDELIPFNASPPGWLIKSEIDFRDGLSQRELSRQMGVKPSFLNEVIKGKRSITTDIAILLEETLGIDSGLWMRMQARYDINNARLKDKNQMKINNIKVWQKIQQYISVKELKKRGLYSDNLQNDIESVFKYYNVEDVDGLKDAVLKSDNDL